MVDRQICEEHKPSDPPLDILISRQL